MARNRIKGITVEIDGDVTKLDKALSSTNKQISETQSNLKRVERLLKLDPKNVEALRQKELLLGQAAESSAAKFETLKKVIETSTGSDLKFEQWMKVFTPLQGQITKITNELSALEKEKKEIESLGFAPNSTALVEVTKKIESANETLNALKKTVTDTYEEMGRPISVKQFDAIKLEFEEAKLAAEASKKAFESFSSALSKFSSTAQAVSDKAAKVADATKGLSLAAGGLLAGMLGSVKGTEEFRSTLSKLETNAELAGIGLDAIEEALKRLNAVSDDTDASVEALSNLLQSGVTESTLQQAVENLAGAASQFPGTIQIENLAESLQETLATGEATGQFAEVLDRLNIGAKKFTEQLSQVPGEVNKLHFALDTLADSGMADVYNAWTENNEALVENKNASLELMQSLRDMATALEPIVTSVTQFATKLLDWFNQLSPITKAAIVSVIGVTAAISPIASVISAIGDAIAGVSKIAGIFTSGVGDKVYFTFAKWAFVIGAVVLAVTALIAMINVLLGKSKDVSSAMDSISNVTSGATQMGGGGTGGGGFGGGGGSPSPQGAATPFWADIPGFANGGVFAPNSPILGVLGDNPREREFAAPESAMTESMINALRQSGMTEGRDITVNVRFLGTMGQLIRVMAPEISVEQARKGKSLLG